MLQRERPFSCFHIAICATFENATPRIGSHTQALREHMQCFINSDVSEPDSEVIGAIPRNELYESLRLITRTI